MNLQFSNVALDEVPGFIAGALATLESLGYTHCGYSTRLPQDDPKVATGTATLIVHDVQKLDVDFLDEPAYADENAGDLMIAAARADLREGFFSKISDKPGFADFLDSLLFDKKKKEEPGEGATGAQSGDGGDSQKSAPTT